MTVDGYSYLQENRPEKPVSAPVIRRRRPTATSQERISPMPLIFGVLVLVIGFGVMKLILNVQRLVPGKAQSAAQVSPSASPVPSPQASQPGKTGASPVSSRCIRSHSRAASAVGSGYFTYCDSRATRNSEGFACFRGAK